MASTSSEQNEKEFNNTFDMNKLYLSDATGDVHFVITVDGKETLVPAHKIILAASSPVFYAMFYGDLKEIGNVKIVDASVEGFKEFLTIFYLDKVKVTKQNVAEFVYLTDKYEVMKGLQMCEEFLMENTKLDEPCTHFELAIKFNLHKLRELYKKEIRADASDIFKSDGFIKINSKVLNAILQLNDHNCTANDVFEGCIKWAEKACERNLLDATDKQNLRHILGDCFYLIPFTAMELTEFIKVASSYRAMFREDEVLDILDFITTGAATKITDNYIKKNRNVFLWDDKSLLTCARQGEYQQMYLLANEFTRFSSSHELLFGGFEFHELIAPTGSTEHLKKKISIVEQDELTDENIQLLSIVDSVKPKVKLDKPVIIKPDVKYFVEVEFEKDAINGWECEQISAETLIKLCTLQPDVQIQFHEGFYSGFYSIISKLYFNRV